MRGRLEQRPIGDQHPRPAVGQHGAEIGRREPRVQRDRHRTELERSEEGGGPAGTVGHEQRHPLLRLDALGAESVGGAVGQALERGVGDGPAGRDERAAITVALLHRRVDEEGGRVVHGRGGAQPCPDLLPRAIEKPAASSRSVMPWNLWRPSVWAAHTSSRPSNPER